MTVKRDLIVELGGTLINVSNVNLCCKSYNFDKKVYEINIYSKGTNMESFDLYYSEEKERDRHWEHLCNDLGLR